MTDTEFLIGGRRYLVTDLEVVEHRRDGSGPAGTIEVVPAEAAPFADARSPSTAHRPHQAGPSSAGASAVGHRVEVRSQKQRMALRGNSGYARRIPGVPRWDEPTGCGGSKRSAITAAGCEPSPSAATNAVPAVGKADQGTGSTN